VDTTEEMGPFEIAPGTQWERGDGFAVSKGYWEQLPQRVRDHLACPVVDELTPITQKHDIEGLVMG
jgi:hypothetical protein